MIIKVLTTRGGISMSLNKGYLTASNNIKSDEMYTPYYCVEPILKYIDKTMTIWCPFDKEWSAYVKLLEENGNKVIYTHIDDGQDFFEFEPDEYDAIISNPPFSKKDKVIKRLYQLGKPFAILLPMNSLQGKERYEYFKNGIQLLSFDQRVGFHDEDNLQKPLEGSPFASAYFCRNILPKDLIIESLEKYCRPLSE